MSTTSSTKANSTTNSVEDICFASGQSLPNEKHKDKPTAVVSVSANNTSLTTITADISQTLSLFECPVCFEYITPPILQCLNFHVFCRTCRQKFTSPAKCPTCREALPKKDIRNHSLEQVAANLNLPFPCKNKEFGCQVTTSLTDIVGHEEHCQHQAYRCPTVTGTCEWTGGLAEVANHLEQAHKFPSYARFTCKVNFMHTLDDLGKQPNDSWQSLIQYNKEHFLYVLTSDDKFNFKAMLFFIGEQKVADKYKYRLTIGGHSDGSLLQMKNKPVSIRQRVSTVFDTGLVLVFSLGMAKVLAKDDVIKINVDIKSKYDRVLNHFGVL